MENKERKIGRPVLYETAEQMQAVIERYCAECEKDKRPLTITGLAFALGMTRQSLLNYEDKDEFFATVTLAKTRVELWVESQLFVGNTAGAKFSLQNNFKAWNDTQNFNVNARRRNMREEQYIDRLDQAIIEEISNTHRQLTDQSEKSKQVERNPDE